MSSLPMIFVRPDELPMIGKFDEPIHLEKAKQPIRMYFKEEELIEEVIDDNVKKDSEYWKRRRQRRRAVKAKSQLVIEDVVAATRDKRGPLKGLMYEGRMSNLNLTDGSAAEASTSKAYQNKEKAKSSTEAPFKFVMLQPRKVIIDGKEQTQILVTPVGDWFSFKKPSVTGQKLLDEIDDDYDSKLVKDKALLSKYKKIEQAFSADNNNHDDIDYDGLKPMASSSSTGGNKKRQAVVASNTPYDPFSLPAAFGRGAATSKSSLSGGRRGGSNRKLLEGNDQMERGGVSSSESEAVADRDAEEEMDEWVGGDYEKTYADDDEANVGEEQMMLNNREDFMAAQEVDAEDDIDAQFDKDGRLVSLERSGGGYDDEDEDEDEEYETEAIDYEEGGGGGGGSSGTVSSSGMVDQDMERGAREYRRVMMAQERQHEQRYQQNRTSRYQEEAVEEKLIKEEGDALSAGARKKRDRNSLEVSSSSSSSSLVPVVSANAIMGKDVATTLTLKKARPSANVTFAETIPPSAATAAMVASSSTSSSSTADSSPVLTSPTVSIPIASAETSSSSSSSSVATSDGGVPVPVTITASAVAPITTTTSQTITAVANIELTEESVREYISNLGGRVTVAALKESYNKKVKEMNKALKATETTAGGKKLVEILLKLTITEDDPLLGKVLRLRYE